MIAIKGIEKIPQTCSDCDLCRGHICKITGTDIIANPKGNCPLVEIVACKDCTYDGCAKAHSPNHYCADAERRE
jgi:hypothetical protein